MEEKRISLEWYSILKDIFKNLWVIVLAALIGFMGVSIVSEGLYTPEYTSSATLVVTAKGGPQSSLYGVSTELAEVYSKHFSNQTIKEMAAEHLGQSSFDGAISATVLTDTNFVELKVTSSSPQKSYKLLHAILEVYPEYSENTYENAVVNVIKYPAMPQSPSNVVTTENKSLIILVCAGVAALAIVAVSVFRDTVKNEEIFASKVESKLLGVIPHETKNKSLKDRIKRKEKGLFIDGNPYISLRFAESFHKIAAKIEYAKLRNGDKVFAITSVAENEGKSTIASNIAVSLAHKGNKVILVDLDGKKPALYKIFGAKYIEKAELGKLLNGELKRNEFRLRRYKKTTLSLAINTNSYPDNYLWIESGVAKDIIDALKEQVDYVIIDTAPLSVDSTVTDIAKFVDKTMLVVRGDTVKVSAINDAILTINEVGGKLAGCILNDVYPEFTVFGLMGNDDNGGYYINKKRYSNNYSYGKYASSISITDASDSDDSDLI